MIAVLGNHSQITSNLDAKIDVTRNEMGNVSHPTASCSGQEIERSLLGDVISKWQYDVTGRPTHGTIVACK